MSKLDLYLFVFCVILEKGSTNLACIPVFLPQTHKVYILKHCTKIVKLIAPCIHVLLTWLLIGCYTSIKRE
jgi:hypothetical protein